MVTVGKKRSDFDKVIKRGKKDKMPAYVDVSGTAPKPSTRTRRTKQISRRVKDATEVVRNKESDVKLGDGFTSASEDDKEFVPEVEVTAEVAKMYKKKMHVAIVDMSQDTKIRCVYCLDIFTLSTAVAHLRNQCKTMMYNMGKINVWETAMGAKKVRSQRCFNSKHSKFMAKFREVKRDNWFHFQFPGIETPGVGCYYPILGGG